MPLRVSGMSMQVFRRFGQPRKHRWIAPSHCLRFPQYFEGMRAMNKTETVLLRGSLLVFGGLFAAVGFGSIVTGGMAGEAFAEINQEFDYLVAQNHYQFYAGVFAAAGATIFLG